MATKITSTDLKNIFGTLHQELKDIQVQQAKVWRSYKKCGLERSQECRDEMKRLNQQRDEVFAEVRRLSQLNHITLADVQGVIA